VARPPPTLQSEVGKASRMAKGGRGLAVAKSISSNSAVKAARTKVQAAKENAMTKSGVILKAESQPLESRMR
jgi:hypothetical protein